MVVDYIVKPHLEYHAFALIFLFPISNNNLCVYVVLGYVYQNV